MRERAVTSRSWWTLALVVAGLDGATWAAPPPSPVARCERLYRRLEECIEEPSRTRDGFMAECLERHDADKWRSQLECASEDNCFLFDACLVASAMSHTPSRDAAEIDKALGEVRQAFLRAEFDKALDACDVIKRRFPGATGATIECQALGGKALTSILEMLSATRGHETTADLARCTDYKKVASRISPAEGAKVKTLCQEIGAGLSANVAVAAARKSLLEGSYRVPGECDIAQRKLTALQSEYGKKRFEEVRLACQVELPSKAATVLRDRLKALRDAGDDADALRSCVVLKEVASRMSEGERRKADVLCAEVHAFALAVRATAQSKRHQTAGILRLPAACRLALTALARVGTPESRERLEPVRQACFVELGRHILAARVPGMRYGCDSAVKQVTDGAREHGVRDPGLDPWLALARPKCQ